MLHATKTYSFHWPIFPTLNTRIQRKDTDNTDLSQRATIARDSFSLLQNYRKDLIELFTKPAFQFFLNAFCTELRGIHLRNCYGSRCQRIGEKSAYMIRIMRDLSKQQLLIFPVVTERKWKYSTRVFAP